MQTSAFYCDVCGRNLDESSDTAPIIAHLIFGLTPLATARHPEGFDFSKVAMPEPIRQMLNKPLPRFDGCLDCLPAVLAHVAKAQPKTADGTRRALAPAKAKAIEAFLADGMTSIRPEHPNRVIREQERKAEEARRQQQGSQAVESPEERAGRLRRELADAEAAVAKTTKASAKRTRRTAAKAADGDS